MKKTNTHRVKTLGRFPWLLPWGLILAFTLFVAAWFRLWDLGTNPTGLSWDEAYLGYVGKMVVQTHRDEFGVFMPTVFKSFGDYKAPLAIYLSGISTTLFGLSTWAVRLPFALAGVMSVGVITAVVGVRTKSWGWGLLAGWLLATLPWHIHFSRVGFESGLALLGYCLFLLGWQVVRHPELVDWRRLAGWSSLLFGAWWALYVYHSAKVVIPLAGVSLAIWELSSAPSYWLKRWREILSVGALGIIGLAPFLLSLIQGSTTRANQVVFWKDLLPQETVWHRLFENITVHLGPSFWVNGATDSLRHGNGIHGVVTLTMITALLGGVALLLWVRQPHSFLKSFISWKKSNGEKHTDLWLWAWLCFVGLIPAILGAEIPHANRALLAVAPFIILTTLTLRLVWQYVQGNTRQLIIAMVLLFSALETANYWKDLMTNYPARSAAAWLEGNTAASQWAASQASGNRSVVVTKEYGEPEIFFAFVTNWSFDRYRWRDFGKVSFADQDKLEEFGAQAVVSAQPLDSSKYTLEGTIDRTDGLPAYWLYQRF